MASPAGLVLLVIIGLAVTAIGVAFVIRGITKAFMKNFSSPGGAPRVTSGSARSAWSATSQRHRGGRRRILFLVAAFAHDPNAAGGLDAGGRACARSRGPAVRAVLLWLVGAGLVIYGLFCFARARYARMCAALTSGRGHAPPR